MCVTQGCCYRPPLNAYEPGKCDRCWEDELRRWQREVLRNELRPGYSPVLDHKTACSPTNQLIRRKVKAARRKVA